MSKKPDKALVLLGVEKAEWWPTVRATAEGAHRLTEAMIVTTYHILEEERQTGGDIPPLTVKQRNPDTGELEDKLNLAYEAVLRERALYYLQCLKLEADASTVEILADIFQRQLYMHHPDQWGSLADFLRNMATGKSASYQSVIERLVAVILPFLHAEGVTIMVDGKPVEVTVRVMMEIITEGGMSNLYHLMPHMLAAVSDRDAGRLGKILTDAKALGRSEIWGKYKRGSMRIKPAYAALGLHNPGPLHVVMEEKVAFLHRRPGPGWQLVITMTDAQKGVILNRLGNRITYGYKKEESNVVQGTQ